MKSFYLRNKELHFKENEVGGLVLKKDKKFLVELNEIGMLIWKTIDKKRSLDSIVKEIAKEYESVDLEELKNDVESFLNQCVENGIVSKF